jgi:aspartyl-tRNA(Asn)/glutamyl-tRNA(Gln) amidotransferase subunit B
VDQVLEENREQVQKYLTGNEKIFGYFVGETMKRTQWRANPKVVNDLLRQKLRSMRA